MVLEDKCAAVNGKMSANRQTSLVPESRICQRCAETSCRFPAALVSRRSYSQSTQTLRSQHPQHLPGSAGSQLEKKNWLGEGPYHVLIAEMTDAERSVGCEDSTAWRHNFTSCLITKLMRYLTTCKDVGDHLCLHDIEPERGKKGGWGKMGTLGWGILGGSFYIYTVSFCTTVVCTVWHWDGMLHCRYSFYEKCRHFISSCLSTE